MKKKLKRKAQSWTKLHMILTGYHLHTLMIHVVLKPRPLLMTWNRHVPLSSLPSALPLSSPSPLSPPLKAVSSDIALVLWCCVTAARKCQILS